MGRQTRSGRRRRKNALGVALIVIVATAAAVLGTVAIRSRNTRTATNANGCPTDAPPAALAVLIIDHTDGLSELQLAELRNRMTDAMHGWPTGTAILVYDEVDRPKAILKRPVEPLCKPAHPNDLNPLKDNIWRGASRWKTFEEAFRRQLQQATIPAPAEQSLILECIQSVAAVTFHAAPYASAQRQYLLIASDMLQNGPAWSQYHGVVPYSQFHLLPYARTVATDLTDVSVEILYLERGLSVQGIEHVRFWENVFRDMGANLDRVTPLR